MYKRVCHKSMAHPHIFLALRLNIFSASDDGNPDALLLQLRLIHFLHQPMKPDTDILLTNFTIFPEQKKSASKIHDAPFLIIYIRKDLFPNLICEIREPSQYHDLPSRYKFRLSVMTMKCSERNHL